MEWFIGFSFLPGSQLGCDFRDDAIVHGATQQKRDSRMRDVVKLLDVHRDHPSVIHQVEEIGIEEGRPSAVTPGFNQERRPDFGDRFLNRPQVQGWLPHGVAKPRQVRVVLRVVDQVQIELSIDIRFQPLVGG